MIGLDEFKRIDLQVGSITAAEALSGTRRLLKVQVDLGQEQRTLVAGVAEHYRPDELVGLQVIVVTNLEPTTIRGIVSEGMMLGVGCDEGQDIALLTVNKEVENGSPVR